MKSFSRMKIAASAAALGLCVVSSAVLAADANLDGGSTPPQSATDVTQGVFGAPSGNYDAYGSARGASWVAATKFAAPVGDGVPPLAYESLNFWRSPGSVAPRRYFAHIDDVPTGAVVDMVSCIYRDTVANDITFTFQKATQNLNIGDRSNQILETFTSSGTPGITFVNMVVAPTQQIRVIPSANIAEQYYVTADVADNTSFSGCAVFYTRAVSPAPAVASFTDVPTSHPFFAFIEALRASGITLGCTATEYCPNDTLTRAQMAAFLARALGLNFPQ